jgi:hypothetical protein
MRSCFVAVLAVVLLWPAGAAASLPYYNQDLGYTIWLPGGWAEVSGTSLSRFSRFHDGLASLETGWEAGYRLESPSPVCLLVSRLPGRVVSKEHIGNFNRFVVRDLKRGCSDHAVVGRDAPLSLTRASFCEKRNMLRLELDGAVLHGRAVTTVVFIVYTSTGMLKFVGLVDPGDTRGVRAVDEAVSTLYLDYGLRQGH